MAKPIHGNPQLDDTVDQICTWFDMRAFPNPKKFMLNMGKKQAQALIKLRNGLNDLPLERTLKVREKQSPNYKKNAAARIAKGDLDLE